MQVPRDIRHRTDDGGPRRAQDWSHRHTRRVSADGEAADSAVVRRARAEVQAGRLWKARDRLVGSLSQGYDPVALDLLGEVHAAMQDLPRAGAAWFGTSRRGEDVDEAVAAWRERYSDDFLQMWRSLPRGVREREGNVRVDALRRRAAQLERGRRTPSHGSPFDLSGPRTKGGPDASVLIAIAVGILVVVCALVGLVTLVGWILPDA